MKKVVVVDDHSILLNLISDFVNRNSNYRVVGTFKSGNELLYAYKKNQIRFDIVLAVFFCYGEIIFKFVIEKN